MPSVGAGDCGQSSDRRSSPELDSQASVPVVRDQWTTDHILQSCPMHAAARGQSLDNADHAGDQAVRHPGGPEGDSIATYIRDTGFGHLSETNDEEEVPPLT